MALTLPNLGEDVVGAQSFQVWLGHLIGTKSQLPTKLGVPILQRNCSDDCMDYVNRKLELGIETSYVLMALHEGSHIGATRRRARLLNLRFQSRLEDQSVDLEIDAAIHELYKFMMQTPLPCVVPEDLMSKSQRQNLQWVRLEPLGGI
jgi:hypothetical protein